MYVRLKFYKNLILHKYHILVRSIFRFPVALLCFQLIVSSLFLSTKYIMFLNVHASYLSCMGKQ